MNSIEEAVARAICDAWGYAWDGGPEDEQTAPEAASDGDMRPDKALCRRAARQAIAAYHAAHKSLEDACRKKAEWRNLNPDDVRRVLTGRR